MRGWYTNRTSRWGISPPKETGRPPPRHPEGPFEGDPHLPQQPVVEQTADEGDAVRHPPRWVEFRQRVVGIRGPVAARLGDVHEAGAQRERRVTGEVRDRELLVAQRRHQQDVNLPED